MYEFAEWNCQNLKSTNTEMFQYRGNITEISVSYGPKDSSDNGTKMFFYHTNMSLKILCLNCAFCLRPNFGWPHFQFILQSG